MPHIIVKCYPKHLTDAQMQQFVDDLTQVTLKHLNTTDASVSISYEEIPAEQWKEKVFDMDIKPNRGKLAKEPGYDM